MTSGTPTAEEVFAVLVGKQRQLGKSVIDFPVSMLQRRFQLGYNRTTALVNELETHGFIRRISETAVQLLPMQDSSGETNNS